MSVQAVERGGDLVLHDPPGDAVPGLRDDTVPIRKLYDAAGRHVTVPGTSQKELDLLPGAEFSDVSTLCS